MRKGPSQIANKTTDYDLGLLVGNTIAAGQLRGSTVDLASIRVLRESGDRDEKPQRRIGLLVHGKLPASEQHRYLEPAGDMLFA